MTTPNKQENEGSISDCCGSSAHYSSVLSGMMCNVCGKRCTMIASHPKEENKMEEWDWNVWRDHFCLHISDWSHFSAYEELEKMKTALVATTRKETLEEVEGALPPESEHLEWGKNSRLGFNTALSQVKDTITRLKERE